MIDKKTLAQVNMKTQSVDSMVSFEPPVLSWIKDRVFSQTNLIEDVHDDRFIVASVNVDQHMVCSIKVANLRFPTHVHLFDAPRPIYDALLRAWEVSKVLHMNANPMEATPAT